MITIAVLKKVAKLELTSFNPILENIATRDVATAPIEETTNHTIN